MEVGLGRRSSEKVIKSKGEGKEVVNGVIA
jgi:hypothetical protein